MNSLIKVEHLKYKRTIAKKLLLTAPLFFILVALLQSCFMPPEYAHSWSMVLALTYNWWPVLFIPWGLALLAGLVTNQEKRAGDYRAVLIHPISPTYVWLGKIVVLVYHMLLTTLVLMGTTLAFGFITATGPVPWRRFLLASNSVDHCSTQIPIQLWIAHTLACSPASPWELPDFGRCLAAQTPY